MSGAEIYLTVICGVFFFMLLYIAIASHKEDE